MTTTITDRLYGQSSGVTIKTTVIAVTNGQSLPLVGLTPVGSYTPLEGDRILVKDQANPITNGIYNASASAWQRTGDFDGSYDVVQGTLVVAFYNNSQGSIFQLITPNPVINTTSLVFVPFWQPPNIVYPQSSIEAAASIVPVNAGYPYGNVHRYGASLIYNSAVNDLPFFNLAMTALGTNGGKITGFSRTYQINGTLDVTTLVTPDFGTSNDGGPTNGFILFSNTNAPILRFNGGARFVDWKNFTILGTTGAGLTAQHGIVVNNAGVRLQNFIIRSCGGDGLEITNSYAGSYRDAYISLCARDGVRVNGGCGGNRWDMITSAGNGGDGFNILSADGGDVLTATDSETNTGAGIRFGNSVIGWRVRGHHSELNIGGSLVFSAGSNRNKIEFRTWGDSSGVDLDPVNNGGTDNSWFGLKFASGGGGFNSGMIEPKLIQRIYLDSSAVSSATPGAIAFTDTLPPSSNGSELPPNITISPKAAGNLIKVRSWGMFSGHLAGNMVAALFKDAETTARAVFSHPNNIDDYFGYLIEYQFSAASTAGINLYTLIGNSSGGLITLNGVNGSRKYGGCSQSGMSAEEFLPMS